MLLVSNSLMKTLKVAKLLRLRLLEEGCVSENPSKVLLLLDSGCIFEILLVIIAYRFK